MSHLKILKKSLLRIDLSKSKNINIYIQQTRINYAIMHAFPKTINKVSYNVNDQYPYLIHFDNGEKIAFDFPKDVEPYSILIKELFSISTNKLSRILLG